MAERPDVFRVRLNCVDHYQNAPSSLDPPIWGSASLSSTQRSNLPQVPVIRVFGATETGQKVCAHIHGAFPYLFIPYTDTLDRDHVDQYITTLRHAIDHALALSYRRNPYDNPRSAAFVAHISLVKGVPFFGYNVGFKHYLKIYLLNPLHMTRFADLLQQGAILKRAIQPYEAHLQYLLQWMCDFNLYGCAYIEVSKPFFRRPLPQWEALDDVAHLWHDRSITPDQILDGERFPRQSHCQVELDIRVQDIINRLEIKPRELHHSFIERLASLENLPPEEKLVHSMAGLWKDETRRRKLRMGLTDPTSSPFPPEVLVSMSADPRNDSEGGWIHEEEFRQQVEELAKAEKQARGAIELSFESFVGPSRPDDGVQTILQSVEELFNDRLMGNLDPKQHESPGPEESSGEVSLPLNGSSRDSDALIDVTSITQLDSHDDYGSDEDAARAKALTQKPFRKKVAFRNLVDVDEEPLNDEDIAAGPDESVPLPLEVIDAAQRKTALKRSFQGGSQGRFKRAKNEQLAHAPHLEDTSKANGRLDDRSQLNKASYAPRSSQRPRQSAQAINGDGQASSQSSSQPSSQKATEYFPVVKDHTDATLGLRLSQRDDLAHVPQRASQSSFKDISFSSDGTAGPRTSSGSKPDGSDNSSWVTIAADDAQVKSYRSTMAQGDATTTLLYRYKAPSYSQVSVSTVPQVIYQDAYYSDEKDVPDRPREYAGQEFRLESTSLPYLQLFDPEGLLQDRKGVVLDKIREAQMANVRARQCSLRAWEIMAMPPTYAVVSRWTIENHADALEELDPLDVDGPPSASQIKRKNRPAPELSQIDGPTQRNKHGFNYSQRKASTSVQHETGYMSTMSVEVHVNSRGDLAPDPERDEIGFVVWSIADDQLEGESKLGIVVLKTDEELPDKIQRIVGNNVKVDAEDDELDLINRMVDIVRANDPDILTGFEVHNGSWGYLIERARLQYEFNLPDEFSRMKSQSHGRFGKDADRWGFTQTSTVRITGRHTINIWRAMRSELNLLQYTMENIVFHLLHQRTPHYPFATLTRWYQSKRPCDLAKVVNHLISRTKLDLEILSANELIPRTSEQARLLGVDFFSVFSRGSQFKVESLMFRIAKPESFVLVSPSRKQVGAQNALECLPLVMEPQSAFYSSPLLVLDFQSLYPSVMIAYNYCYSTCLGRIVNWRGSNKMGFADFQRTPGLLELVKDKLNIAPNGMMYVKPEMRKSLLAKMLGEILETRVMVKSGMKVDKDDKTLQQLLNNRQLALKLIANVTYGYTSASFSGRMPCSEIADSIVQTGRETLEKTIALIHSVERWGAEVVYGDTDSLFVYLKGRSREEAFKIGDEIAKTVTDMNPRPIKLKFEKVYHPCVLLAKKRYVGFKYESPKQTEPEFDAKGIETVRRDGTPAEQKIEEKALKLLFRTSDLSQVKRFFQAQCNKVMTGRFSVQDFCFAKEVKLGTYADKGPPPPGALIATRRMLRDPRTEPQYGERVPYVVIAGAPGARLWERCVEPERLIHDENAELDAEYYISKNLIPPLERIFNLVGANVRQWYDEMPKIQRIRMLGGPREGDVGGAGKSRKTMESYMGSSLCLVCRSRLPPVPPQAEEVQLPLCDICQNQQTQKTLLALRRQMQKAEIKVRAMHDVCRSCANLAQTDDVSCDSRDCPVFYSRVKADTKLRVVRSGVGRVLDVLQERVAAESGLEW